MKKLLMLPFMLYLVIGSGQNIIDLGLHIQPNYTYRYFSTGKIANIPEMFAEVYGGFGCIARAHLGEKMTLGAEVDIVQRRFGWEVDPIVQDFRSNNLDISLVAGYDLNRFLSIGGGVFTSRLISDVQYKVDGGVGWRDLEYFTFKPGSGILGQVTLTLDRLYITPRANLSLFSLSDVLFTDNDGNIISESAMREVLISVNVGVWLF